MVMAPENRKNSSMSCEEFGTLVATNPQALLSFYVDHSKMSLGRLRQGLINLTQNPLDNLPSLKRETDEVAFDLVSLSPGTDYLQNPDLEMLFHHCSFVSIWMNLAYLAATDIGFMEMPEEVKSSKNVLIQFIEKLLNVLTPEFRRLQLDSVEFAALKAISVWKMSILGDNETARVLSGEQYLGVAKALNEYHQAKNLQDFEKAGRLADITSLMAPISALYQEMITVYTTLNIDDCYRGDFC
ncbi:unnamed protein product [Caenorhabditis nigoni]